MVYSWDPLAEASAGESALVAGVADLLAGPSLRHFAMAKTPAWLAVGETAGFPSGRQRRFSTA